MGEPAGIGPEIILRCWQLRQQQSLPAFFILGSHKILVKTARILGLNIPMKQISSPAETNKIFKNSLPVFDMGNADFELGKPSKNTADMVINAIKMAVTMIYKGEVAGLVTAPIQKSILYDAGFSFPGHTEYLAELCKENGGKFTSPVMMLMSKELRVVPLTIHMALSQVPKSITPDLIRDTCLKINQSLQQDFGIINPKIAVAGLNPHAGEDGTMGDEEERIIRPTLNQLRNDGLDITGPLPADTMFHDTARSQYDAALCMYHDQALIPLKTLDFDGGVNVTIGLPIVRTSPDHGTALVIAGKNRANPQSMINALKSAQQIYQNRLQWSTSHV